MEIYKGLRQQFSHGVLRSAARTYAHVDARSIQLTGLGDIELSTRGARREHHKCEQPQLKSFFISVTFSVS